MVKSKFLDEFLFENMVESSFLNKEYFFENLRGSHSSQFSQGSSCADLGPIEFHQLLIILWFGKRWYIKGTSFQQYSFRIKNWLSSRGVEVMEGRGECSQNQKVIAKKLASLICLKNWQIKWRKVLGSVTIKNKKQAKKW